MSEPANFYYLAIFKDCENCLSPKKTLPFFASTLNLDEAAVLRFQLKWKSLAVSREYSGLAKNLL